MPQITLHIVFSGRISATETLLVVMAYVDDLIDSLCEHERFAYVAPPTPKKHVNAIRVNQAGLRIGECHQRAKYTDAQIEHMRSLHDAGVTYKEIAVMYQTNIYVIGKICRYEVRNQYADRVKIVEVE